MPQGKPDFSFIFRRPFAEQVAFFRGKLGNLVPTQTWRDLMREQHDRAFMVAGAAKADLLADLAEAVDKAIAEGETLESFRKRFFEIVERRGWHGWTGEETKKGRAWRTRVIYQTNLATSYAAGRLAQLRAGGYRYWMYKHSDAVTHPRPHHLAMDGVVRPADDPFWKTWFPPNGWGCRCRVVGVRSPEMARALGGDPDKPLPSWWNDRDAQGRVVGIDEGWDYMPGETAVEHAIERKAASLPAPLADALRAEERVYPRPIQEAAASIQRAVEAEQDKMIEYAALVRDGKMAWIKRGERQRVAFSPDEVAQFRGATLLHNHPSSYSLSNQDLILALTTGLRRIYAIGSDGSIYAARVTAASLDDLQRAYNIVKDNTFRLLSSWVNSGRIAAADAEKFHSHIVNAALSKLGQIRYHAILASETPAWVWHAIDIIGG